MLWEFIIYNKIPQPTTHNLQLTQTHNLQPTCTTHLNIKPKVHDITILHNIGFAFNA